MPSQPYRKSAARVRSSSAISFAAGPGTGSTRESLIRILPGQYYDAETQTHYNYFRDYDPTTGRYTESDPIGLKGGVNTYAYVLNNPLTQTDPYGQVSCQGRWLIWESHTIGMEGRQPITNPGAIVPTCICVWLCQDCVAGSAVGNGLGLPRTFGTPWFDGSKPGGRGQGSMTSGNQCLCSKPGPETGCNICYSNYPGPFNVQNPRWLPD